MVTELGRWEELFKLLTTYYYRFVSQTVHRWTVRPGFKLSTSRQVNACTEDRSPERAVICFFKFTFYCMGYKQPGRIICDNSYQYQLK